MGCFERDWSLAWIWDWVRIRGIGDRRSGWMGLGGGGGRIWIWMWNGRVRGGHGMDWDEMSWDEYLDDNDNEYTWRRGKGS